MSEFTRRRLLRDAMTIVGAVAAGAMKVGAVPHSVFARQRGNAGASGAAVNNTLALARAVNRMRYEELPAKAVEHAKMILASTFSSAAPGALIDSARILRDLAKERGGRPEATVWFDAAKLPAASAALVNAGLSDAAASDDSDIRNTAHYGTTLASAGLAIAERTGATGKDLLGAMVIGYEAAGRIGDARRGGRGGLHASQLVAFGGAVAVARLLKLTDEQMAHALGIVATTMGGIAIGTNSWAREYMGANAAGSGVDAAEAAARGYTVNDDMLGTRGGFVDTFGGGRDAVRLLSTDLGQRWDIVEFLAIKLWPGAHPFSGTLEAAVNAARQANVPADGVAKILIAGPDRTNIGGSRRPRDLVEAIHSLPYFVASAVADKEFTWIHATEGKIFDPTVAKLMAVVELDPAPPSVTYKWSWGGSVTVVTTSGQRFTSTVDAPRGSGQRGIEWSDVDAKYRALMPDSKLPAARLGQILDQIHQFESVKSVPAFARLLTPAG
jgi:2-methylcitrate dehydratase PrpD